MESAVFCTTGRACAADWDAAESPFFGTGLRFFTDETPTEPAAALCEADGDTDEILYRYAEVFRGAHAALDEEYSQAMEHFARAGQPSPCGVGCSACCKQVILSNPFEAMLIARYLATPGNPLRSFLARYEHWDARTRDMRRAFPGWAARMVLHGEDDGSFDHRAFSEPCPFMEDDRCVVYPVRPYGCRSYFALTDDCRNPTKPGLIAGRQGIGVGMSTGYHQRRQQLLGLLWGQFGVSAARTRGHFLPELVKLALEADLHTLLIRCVVVAP